MKNMLISAITGWYEMDFEHVKKSARERIFWYFLSIRNIASGKLLSGRSEVRILSRTFKSPGEFVKNDKFPGLFIFLIPANKNASPAIF